MYITLLFFFLLLILLPIRGYQKWGGFSTRSTQYLKLILTLAILWHHMPSIGFPILDRLGGIVGRYGVSIFFFLSGFGLMKGLLTQGKEQYFASFFRKRFSKLLIPLSLVFCCYAIFNYQALTFSNLISNWKHGTNFVSYSYFVEELCTLYLLFFIIFRFASIRVGLILSWLSAIALMGCYIHLDYHEHWWISTLGFPMGISLALIKHKGEATLWQLAAICFCLLSAYKIMRYYADENLELACYNFALFMTPHVCLLSYLIIPVIKTKFIIPCSWIINNSYEIYLLQGLIIGLFIKHYGFNEMSMWGMFATLVLVSFIMHQLAALIDRGIIQKKHQS